jgi:hypothetical protein
LARDGALMEEFRGLRSQVTRASDEMEHRDLVADLDRSLASPVV